MKRLGWMIGLTWSGNLWAQEAEPGESNFSPLEVRETSSAGIEIMDSLGIEKGPGQGPPGVSDRAGTGVSVIRIHTDGTITLQGRPVPRRRVVQAIEERLEVAPNSRWRLELEPDVDQRLHGQVSTNLYQAGVSEFRRVDVRPHAEEESSEAVAVEPRLVGGAVAWVGPASFYADLRLGMAIDQLDALQGEDDHLDPTLSFGVQRGVMGLAFDLDSVSGLATIDVQSASGFVDEEFDTEGGDSGVIRHPVSTTGFTTSAHQIYIDFRPVDWLRIRAGVQDSIFGSVGRMDDLDGFYTMTPNYMALPVLAGLVERFDTGVATEILFADGRGQVDLQATRFDGVSEDDEVGTDHLSGRLSWQISEPFRVSVSGMSDQRGDTADSSIGAGSVLVEMDTGAIGLLSEFLWGSWDVDARDGLTDRLMGGQVAARGDLSIDAETIDTLRLVARGAYFDPRQETTDADAYFLYNLSLQALWASRDETRVSTGLGYEIELPINENEAIGHRAMLTATTRF